MPVKQRAAKERRPSFSAEAIALFLELEQTPRSSERFKTGSQDLACLLGLVSEWWYGADVNDVSRAPSHPPGYLSHDAFWRVREVREALLAATGGRTTSKRGPGTSSSA